jgi:hypothetical protein
MKKLIATLICLMPLGGCWWDSAPETYKGTAEIKFDNGQTASRDFQCDFRAQQATRKCDFSIDLNKEEMQKAFEDYSDDKVVLNFSISANGRKEDRYMITVLPPFFGESSDELSRAERMLRNNLLPLKLKSVPVARTENNIPAYVVDADQLEDGFPISIIVFMLTGTDSTVQITIKWEPVPANSLSS